MRFAKIIRMLTVAPVMALLLLTGMFLFLPGYIGGLQNYLCSVLFLTVLPVLGYPLQPIVPGFKDKGREGQRNLAIVMAVVGYVAALVYAAVAQVPPMLWVVYLTYFISGIGIVLFNKVVKVRASGHACGVAGPLAFLVYLAGLPGLLGGILLALVYRASLKMKRHTLAQLVWGTGIPVLAFGTSMLVVGLAF